MLMMAVMFFMFQFSQVAREGQSNYNTNIHIGETSLSGAGRWKAEETGEFGDTRKSAVLLTQSGSSLETVVSQWCEYTKRELQVFGSVEEAAFTEGRLPEAVLVDSDALDIQDETEFFDEVADLGITLIFCNLPGPQVIRDSEKLQKILGIQSVREDSIEVEGIHLLGGFLLGGESMYRAETEEDEKLQDLERNVPWYVTAGGTKTYMVGTLDELLKEEEARNEYFPGLIWRNGYRHSRVFVVNGRYMDSMEGIGILSAMMYEAAPYALYPVVNAQNILVADFPGLAGENDGKMEELYSRDTKGLQQNICWPDISGMAMRDQYRLTCFMAAQYDYMDGIGPSSETIPFYLQQFRESNAEAGISLTHADTTVLAGKLAADDAFYGSVGEPYAYAAAYVEETDLERLAPELGNWAFLKDLRTVACRTQEGAPIVSYWNDDITLQSVTAFAPVHKYSDNLRLKCYETALGYSNTLIDMHNVLWPESEEDRWENASEDMISNLDTYWKPFSSFQHTTLSESDARIRTFLNLDYQEKREQDEILLRLSGVDEGWFLLRTHGEKISDIEGGEYQKTETDAYLIHALEGVVRISLESERKGLNYRPD